MRRKVLMILLLFVSHSSLLAQDKKNQWIDSVFNTMGVEEKAGQLFVIPASSYYSENEIEDLLADIHDHHPGGIIITGGGPSGTASLIRKLQAGSRVPPLIMMRAARGPGEVLDSLITFPNLLNLGATTSDTLCYNLGKEIGRQMKLLGLHMNLAPNADIDVLQDVPENYLGTNKHRVAKQAKIFVRGLRSNGIMAGATHHAMEVDDKKDGEGEWSIDFINNRLDTTSFYPYEQLIKDRVGGIVTSHLHFSLLDKRKSIPASLSQLFVSDVMKKKLNFEGLAITEIPYIHEISGKSKSESERLAFEIGNDLLLDPYNLNGAIRRIVSAVKKNSSLKLQLDQSVRRILAAKYDAGLATAPRLGLENLSDRINSPEAAALKIQLAQASISLVKNESGAIPIQTLDGKKFVSLSIGHGNKKDFDAHLRKYTNVHSFSVENIEDTLGLRNNLRGFDLVIASVYSIPKNQKFGILNWLNDLQKKQKTILCSFGNPFDLRVLDAPSTLLIGYTDEAPIPMIAAQAIFGARRLDGTLPLSINEALTEGMGSPNQILDRLAYGIPEQVGMSSDVLKKIDDIVKQAIDSGATPGCNIIVARDGMVVYQKAMGWKTYEKTDPVTEETIYDLASITKVAATLQTVMFMHDKNLIDINKKASHYLPELKQTNKQDFTIKDILTHQAGLWPYLPFWQQTMKDAGLLPTYYSKEKNVDYPFPVSKDLFATRAMKDSLWRWIIKAKVREKLPRTPYDYTYSDMGFYILQHLAEKLLNQPMEDFVSQNFYEPLGAVTTGFLPLERFPESQIAPTEADMQFRKSTLVGYVHDQGAAMHAGVAGHAGLFSSANDLAKLGQMWLQKGRYGGLEYFKPGTIELFTSRQFETNRRGLGWDKPTVSDWNGPTTLYASPATFGHTGFTGTAIWVDPEFNLVFVFLSNRVYPDMFNNRLLTGNIRPRIQEVIYQSIFEYCKFRN